MVNCMQTSVFLPKIATTLQIIKIGISKINCAWKVAFLKSKSHFKVCTKAQKNGSHFFISYQFLLLSTIILNDKNEGVSKSSNTPYKHTV